MYINEQYQNLALLETSSYKYIGKDGVFREESGPILKEHLMDVYVNDRLTMKLICIPQFLAELVLGRLLTEGIIRSDEDVEQIYICEYGARARVLLKESTVRDSGDFVETTPSCCTGNHILNDYFITHTQVTPVTPVSWETSHIFALADRFSEGMPLHSQTFATHSCFLAQGETLLFQCEDIGRHNALDKAIGYAIRHA